MAEAPTPLTQPSDLVEALALLTRLPVPAHAPRGHAAAWAWPVAGLVVALLVGVLASLALALGTPPVLAAGLALAVQVVLTGGLHEDGLADCADGFWGGQTRARRLEIMKDSRTGSYGVIALFLGLGLRWTALGLIFADGSVFAPLIATAALSRGAIAVLMAVLPNARGSGLAETVGRPTQETALLAVAAALFIGFATAGWALLAPLLWTSLTAIGVAAVAKAKIGGQTGDVLGAAQQVTEIAALVAFASLL